MSLTSTGPASEPVALAELKTHLRVSSTAEDSLISALGVAARTQYETETNRILVNQTFTWKIDCFPESAAFFVPRAPLVSVTSIVYTDTAGTATTWGSSEYIVGVGGEPGRIALAEGESWPTTDPIINPITITFTAGHSSVASGVEDIDKAAIKLVVGDWYRHRESVVPGLMSGEIPNTLKTIIWGRKVVIGA